MQIRRLTSQDKEELKKLLRQFYIEDTKRFSHQVQRWEEYKDDQKTIEETAEGYLNEDKNKFLTYVAEKNNQLVGHIRGEIKDRPHKKYFYREGHV